MRRREKFIITAIFLGICLLFVQSVPLEWKYLAVGLFVLVTYGISGWVLSDDLQRHERLTVVPLPALYAGSVALFYFLLPANFMSKVLMLLMFGIGMYALFLTANIYSVAKGRTIQLLHAAQAIGLWFTLIISLFFANTIFSLKLPFYLNGLFVGLTHFPLIYMSLWSVRLEQRLEREVGEMSLLLTVILIEISILFSFLPQTVWYQALFVMSVLYLGLSILRSFLAERLFINAVREFSLVAAFVVVLFMLAFPLK